MGDPAKKLPKKSLFLKVSALNEVKETEKEVNDTVNKLLSPQ